MIPVVSRFVLDFQGKPFSGSSGGPSQSVFSVTSSGRSIDLYCGIHFGHRTCRSNEINLHWRTDTEACSSEENFFLCERHQQWKWQRHLDQTPEGSRTTFRQHPPPVLPNCSRPNQSQEVGLDQHSQVELQNNRCLQTFFYNCDELTFTKRAIAQKATKEEN